MTGNFFESETKENLMKSLPGESQAKTDIQLLLKKPGKGNVYKFRILFFVYSRAGTGACREVL